MNTTGLFLLVLFAFGGHRYSVRNEMVRGTTPWHVPSMIWALICLATGPFGLLVEFVAVRTTKPQSVPVPAANGGQAPEWSPVPATESDAVPVAAQPPGVPAPQDGSGKSALFGWYPDPTARHERRYWDGRGWTKFVEDHMVTAEDPI
jgi:hypothetical protein